MASSKYSEFLLLFIQQVFINHLTLDLMEFLKRYQFLLINRFQRFQEIMAFLNTFLPLYIRERKYQHFHYNLKTWGPIQELYTILLKHNLCDFQLIFLCFWIPLLDRNQLILKYNFQDLILLHFTTTINSFEFEYYCQLIIPKRKNSKSIINFLVFL